MNAITVKQPWATLIGRGRKRFETRSTKQRKATGILAIHASKTFGPFERKQCLLHPFEGLLGSHGITLNTATHNEMPRGVIVAVASVKAIWPADHVVVKQFLADHPFEAALGDFTPGRWAYELDRVWPVSDLMIFARGQLGIWTLPNGVEHRVKLALQHHDDLPADLTSPDLIEEAVAEARRRTAKAWEVDALLARLTGRQRERDTRTPIDRMIDKAVGRG